MYIVHACTYVIKFVLYLNALMTILESHFLFNQMIFPKILNGLFAVVPINGYFPRHTDLCPQALRRHRQNIYSIRLVRLWYIALDIVRGCRTCQKPANMLAVVLNEFLGFTGFNGFQCWTNSDELKIFHSHMLYIYRYLLFSWILYSTWNRYTRINVWFCLHLDFEIMSDCNVWRWVSCVRQSMYLSRLRWVGVHAVGLV